MLMQIVNLYKKHQTIFQILLFPFVLMVVNILILTIMNLGVYLGTFLRGLLELVV